MLAGALVGSDVFNVLGVLGLTAFLHPLAVTHGANASLMMMVGMVAMLMLLMRTGWRRVRWGRLHGWGKSFRFEALRRQGGRPRGPETERG